MNVQLKSGEVLELSNKPLGAPGAEGVVYGIISPAKYASNCVKLYNDRVDKANYQKKITFMVNNPPKKLEDKTYKVCWPQETIYKNRTFAGFMMPQAFENSTTGFDFCQLNMSNRLDKSWHLEFQRGYPYCLMNRLKLSVNLALAIHRIHEQKQYTLVDLKPQNLLVNKNGKISIIDTDGIQINENGNVRFGTKLSTPEYMPPEAKKFDPMKQWIPQSWDRFAFAVILYQILIGIHPYAGSSKPPYSDKNTIMEKIQNGLFPFGAKSSYMAVTPEPHKLFLKLPITIQQLFLKAFNGNPSDRPTIQEWGKTIYKEVKIGENNNFPKPTQIKAQNLKTNKKPNSTNITTIQKPQKKESVQKTTVPTSTKKSKTNNTGLKQPAWGKASVQTNNIASRTSRFFAALLDNMFAFILAYFVAFVLALLFYAGGANSGAESFIAFILIIAYILYFALGESSSKQAAWGKQILGIKVVDANNLSKISFGQALGRTLLKNIPVIGTIAIISILFNKDNAGLHDKAAETLVVNK